MYSSVNSKTRSSAPTVSAHWSAIAMFSWRSTSSSAPPGSPTMAEVGSRTWSRRTVPKPAHQIETLSRDDGHAGRGGWDEDLGEAGARACGDEEVVSRRRRFGIGLRAVDRHVAAVDVGGRAHRGAVPAAARLAMRPGRHRVPGEEPGQHLFLLLVRARGGQRGGYDVRGKERDRGSPSSPSPRRR